VGAITAWFYWPEGTEHVTAVVTDEDQPLEIMLSDGTTIFAPPGSLSAGSTVSAKKLDPEEAPPLSDSFEKMVFLYDFSVDRPLEGKVNLNISLPEVSTDSVFLLAHYRDGVWEAVPFTLKDRIAYVETDSLSLWGWIALDSSKLAGWIDAKIMEYLDTDRYINKYRELMGISTLMQLELESTPSYINYDDSGAMELIAASAIPIEGDRIRLRVRNKTKFHLQLSFTGSSNVEAQKGNYLSALDEIYRSTMTPDVLRHLSALPSQEFLLLPEGTAEFVAVYEPGKTLNVNAKFSDIAALFSSLDPLLGLVPVADLELFTAIRDLRGEQDNFVRSIADLERSSYDRTMELLNFVEAVSRTGVLLGENAAKTLANMLVFPAVVEFRKDYLEGRIPDIVEKGPQASKGVNLLFEFPLEEYYIVAVAEGSNLYIRKSPGAKNKPTGDIIERVPRGRLLEIINKHDNSIAVDGFTWWEIRDSVTGKTGWVASEYLEKSETIEDTATIQSTTDYYIDDRNGTIPIGDLPIGARVVDPSWEWEFRSGKIRSDDNYPDSGVVKPVTWIVVAKDHYDGLESHVTLLAEELIIGKSSFDMLSVFDNSTDRGSLYGSNHWGDSGTTNATRGLRPWLNSTDIQAGEGFYQAFSESFKNSVLNTPVPNREWKNGSAYSTRDKVFIPSTTELGDTTNFLTYQIGTVYSYFQGAGNARRVAKTGALNGGTNGWGWWYWTRSPDSKHSDIVKVVSLMGDFGGYGYDSANYGWCGVRPALNLKSEILASEINP